MVAIAPFIPMSTPSSSRVEFKATSSTSGRAASASIQKTNGSVTTQATGPSRQTSSATPATTVMKRSTADSTNLLRRPPPLLLSIFFTPLLPQSPANQKGNHKLTMAQGKRPMINHSQPVDFPPLTARIPSEIMPDYSPFNLAASFPPLVRQLAAAYQNAVAGPPTLSTQFHDRGITSGSPAIGSPQTESHASEKVTAKHKPGSYREAVSASWAQNVDVSFPPSSAKAPSTFEGEPAFFISEEEELKMAHKFRFALIGKFNRGRPAMTIIRKEVLSAGFSGECHVGLIDQNHIILQFELESDSQRLWLKKTWSFRGFQANFFRWSTGFCPDKESSIAPVWTSFPLLPVHLCNKETLFSFGSAIGDPLKLDLATAAMEKVLRPSEARLCIAIDVLKPLPRRLRIGTKDKGWWQQILYEDLPEYCTTCSKIGHSHLNCKRKPPTQVWLPKKKEAEKEKTPVTEVEKKHQLVLNSVVDEGNVAVVEQVVFLDNTSGNKAAVTLPLKGNYRPSDVEQPVILGNNHVSEVPNSVEDLENLIVAEQAAGEHVVAGEIPMHHKIDSPQPGFRNSQVGFHTQNNCDVGINVNEVEDSGSNLGLENGHLNYISSVNVNEVENSGSTISGNILHNKSEVNDLASKILVPQVSIIDPLTSNIIDDPTLLDVEMNSETIFESSNPVTDYSQVTNGIDGTNGNDDQIMEFECPSPTFEGPHVTKSTEGKQMLVGVCATNDCREKGAVLLPNLGIEDGNAELQLAWKNLLLSSQNAPGTNATKKLIDGVTRDEEFEHRGLLNSVQNMDLNEVWNNLVGFTPEDNCLGEVSDSDSAGTSLSGSAFSSNLSRENFEDVKKQKYGMSDRVLRSMRRAYNSDPSRADSL